jgi:hypothetical protein
MLRSNYTLGASWRLASWQGSAGELARELSWRAGPAPPARQQPVILLMKVIVAKAMCADFTTYNNAVVNQHNLYREVSIAVERLCVLCAEVFIRLHRST